MLYKYRNFQRKASNTEVENINAMIKLIRYSYQECNQNKFSNLIVEDDYKLFQPKFNMIHKVITTPPIYKDQEMLSILKYANELRENFKYFIVVGMGGAILNPKAVIEAMHSNDHIYFNNSLNLKSLELLRDKIDLEQTAFIIISKSGKTQETISLFDYWNEQLRRIKAKNISGHFTFITSNITNTDKTSHSNTTNNSYTDDNVILKTAKALGSKIFIHPPDIGGRFSTFTIVNILTGYLAGNDMQKFCEGGVEVFNDLIENGLQSNVIQSVGDKIAHYNKNYRIYNYTSYFDNLSSFLEWRAQINSESIAKDGLGITTIYGIGPQEQHSRLQLFLDGPNDKFHTFILPKINSANDSISKINAKCAELTVSQLKENNRPVCVYEVREMDIKTTGALMMHAILETIILALLIGVNPYDQPSIDKIKQDLLMNKGA